MTRSRLEIQTTTDVARRFRTIAAALGVDHSGLLERLMDDGDTSVSAAIARVTLDTEKATLTARLAEVDAGLEALQPDERPDPPGLR